MTIRSMPRLLLSALALSGLAACTSFVPETTAKLRALDTKTDDLASLVVALDLPSQLRPVPELSKFHFDVTGAVSGERHIVATLALTDPGELAGTLPPPANGRSYYLFGFSEADKAALREAQAFARSQPVTTTIGIPVTVSPQFCTVSPIDPAKSSFSVLLALPNTPGLAPLVTGQPVSSTLTGTQIPAC